MGSNKAWLLAYQKQFMQRWKSHNLGKAKEYIGMRITRNCKKWTITLDQTCYAEKVVKWFGQENCKPVSVPFLTRYNPRSNPKKEANTTLQSWYQSVIGSLLYIMLRTQSDIAYSIIKMSQCSVNPTKEHLQKALNIVHYLSSTMDLCICYSGLGDKNGFIIYSDMDWGGDVETSWSTTSYAMCYRCLGPPTFFPYPALSTIPLLVGPDNQWWRNLLRDPGPVHRWWCSKHHLLKG